MNVLKKVRVFQTSDPTWKRWGIMSNGCNTEWVKGRKRAIAIAIERLGGPTKPYCVRLVNPNFPQVYVVSG